MKRVVLDTNVLVSSLLFRGSMAKFVELWQQGSIVPVISRETFAELQQVLRYPKFALTDEEIKAIIEEEVIPFFDVVEVKEKVKGVCRDPYDDMFLSVAASAGGAWIVTGDKDLLVLKKYGTARIVTPQKFLEGIE